MKTPQIERETPRPRIRSSSATALAVVSLLLFALPRPAEAQIVNVQTSFSELFKEGYEASFDLSADWRTGNLALVIIGAQANLQYGIAGHQIMGSLRGDLTVAEGISDGRRTFEHLRYRYWLAERWATEAFLQHEFDPNRRFRVRLLAGAGPRFVPVHGEKAAISLGLALMGEYNEISRGVHVDSGNQYTFLRLSSYVVGKLAVGDNASFTQSLYAQPRVDDPVDIRLLSESSIAVPLTERVAINLSFVATLQSRPPAGVLPLDTRLLTRLTVKL